MFPTASLTLIVSLSITGCSKENNEISEIEKRNRFDVCVLDFMANPDNQSNSSWKFDDDKFRQAGELECRNLLR